MAAAHGVTRGSRFDAMADRLGRTAVDAGLDADAAASLVAHLRATFRARSDITDPGDPRALHPARNALILLEDAGVRDAVELCAAIRFDATRPAPAAAEIADPRVRAVLETVPRADEAPERLLEDLVGAPDAARRIALADHLDHARHLHLAEPASWATFHAETRDIWLPVAERTHPTLARRFRWWAAMFQRRWLPPARP